MQRNVLLLAAAAGVIAVIGGIAGFAAVTRAATVALMLFLFMLPWTEQKSEL